VFGSGGEKDRVFSVGRGVWWVLVRRDGFFRGVFVLEVMGDEVPEDRCGHTVYDEQLPSSLGGICCWRPTWNDEEKCIWHAKVYNKPYDDLVKFRTGNPERLDEAYLQGVEFHSMPILLSEDIELCLDNFFYKSSFYNSDFSNSKITEMEILGCDFTDCNFFDSEIVNSTMSRSLFTQANFSETRLSGVKTLRASFVDASFTNALIRVTEFYDSPFSSVDFSSSSLRAVDWIDSGMSYVNMTDCLISPAAPWRSRRDKTAVI
jgi:hypothetical protein